VASLYPKKVNGGTYWYLREMARVDGKPKMVSERYVGTAADIEAMLGAREAAVLPGRTRHLAFGAVAAAWGMIHDLGVIALIDAAAGPRPGGQPLSTGTYLALAALNRLVAPCSKAGFADWWKTTAADRFTKVPASSLDHRRFWDAMHAVTPAMLEQASEAIAAEMVRSEGIDVSSVALDMTNFATFIATGNQKAPIAQRGKAKQKRTDLRIVGLGLVVTRDGGIPLTWHAYAGDRPDVTQFPLMTAQLKARYEAACAAAGLAADTTDMTVVFDAGQNSEDNLAYFAKAGMHYIGSVPASDCADLLALPAKKRKVADEKRFGGLTAFDTRRVAFGAERRAVLTHSPELHEAQALGFTGTTLAKAAKKMDELAATLARGKTRRTRDKVEAEIASITAQAWVKRVIRWELDGEQPRDLRLSWHADEQAMTALEEEIFGKHVLITSHDDWAVPDVIASRLPLPVRGRVRLPPAQGPPRGLLLAHAPLDRAQHPGPYVHLRPGPADRPPHAPPRPRRRPRPVRPRPPGPAGRHRRDRADLPLIRRPAQSPPDDHRAHPGTGQTPPGLRPRPVGTPPVRSYAENALGKPPTSRNAYRGRPLSETPASTAGRGGPRRRP